MGYFHQGHLELMKVAKKENDYVVISIFVNPLQFGPKEDFKKYPRDLKKDIKMAEQVGVDLIFAPSDKEMYSKDFSTYVEVTGNLTQVMCGKSRPGHFKGVTTVVLKLFNIVQPDVAYFGKKDYQQFIIVKKMVKDLNFPIKIVPVNTVREKDKLAMSSRNTYLNKEGREKAQVLYQSLKLAEEKIKKGEKNAKIIKEKMEKLIKEKGEIDYISIAHPETLQELEKIEGKVLVALAVRIDGVRLIDNKIIGGKS
jgi:pantoate--beta-alanine ligase